MSKKGLLYLNPKVSVRLTQCNRPHGCGGSSILILNVAKCWRKTPNAAQTRVQTRRKHKLVKKSTTLIGKAMFMTPGTDGRSWFQALDGSVWKMNEILLILLPCTVCPARRRGRLHFILNIAVVATQTRSRADERSLLMMTERSVHSWRLFEYLSSSYKHIQGFLLLRFQYPTGDRIAGSDQRRVTVVSRPPPTVTHTHTR